MPIAGIYAITEKWNMGKRLCLSFFCVLLAQTDKKETKSQYNYTDCSVERMDKSLMLASEVQISETFTVATRALQFQRLIKQLDTETNKN